MHVGFVYKGVRAVRSREERRTRPMSLNPRLLRLSVGPETRVRHKFGSKKATGSSSPNDFEPLRDDV